ncbi:hypothetical protein B0T20DRAFT_72589 [Sordaria brevicollis]|uniref:Uncharacterized protein n=1 Tax=Sordaria brevicollis TaxID=83679 RepID=A0AAE0P2D0_SORBR|nr:hypothetical protein B0T20DRAFT_72589 [Sordaria brevicollis]
MISSLWLFLSHEAANVWLTGGCCFYLHFFAGSFGREGLAGWERLGVCFGFSFCCCGSFSLFFYIPRFHVTLLSLFSHHSSLLVTRLRPYSPFNFFSILSFTRNILMLSYTKIPLNVME